MFVRTRVMLITQNVQFALDVGQLERSGEYQVAKFSSVRNALEYLSQYAQHVLILDMNTPGCDGPAIFETLRDIQPDLSILLTPETVQVWRWVEQYNLQGVVRSPVALRTLVEIIETVLTSKEASLPETMVGQPLDLNKVFADMPQDDDLDEVDPSAPTPQRPLELRLSDDEDGETSVMMVEELDYSQTGAIFQRLAAEEPPVPGFEESATVRDVLEQAQGAAQQGQVLRFKRDEEDDDQDKAAPEEKQEPRSIPATLMLEEATDSFTPLSGFSIQEFLARIEERMPPDQGMILPLPSWVQEDAMYVREPDFLASDLPPADLIEQSFEYTASTTVPASGAPPSQLPEDHTTERMTPEHRSRPPAADELPQILIPEDTSPALPLVDEIPTSAAEVTPVVDRPPSLPELPAKPLPAAPPDLPEPAVLVPPPISSIAPAPPDAGGLPEDDDTVQWALRRQQAPLTAPGTRKTLLPEAGDPYLARLALTITQLSLELTAEATLLALDGEVVAYAGNLPIEDVDSLRQQIRDDWESAPNEARIRYLRFENTGPDYMMYSCRTIDGFTLALIYSGTLPITTIRRQWLRLRDALEAVPEPGLSQDLTPEAGLAVKAESITGTEEELADLRPYSFVWLLRESANKLDDAAMQAVLIGLDAYLATEQWHVQALEVHTDYVYLFANAPDEEAPVDLVHELMDRSAELVQSFSTEFDAATVWADSYLALTPGRALSPAEIERFIQFVRS